METIGHVIENLKPEYRAAIEAANIRHSNCGREVRALDMPEPEDLSQRPDNDQKLNRDSYLSPTFSGHAENCRRMRSRRNRPRIFRGSFARSWRRAKDGFPTSIDWCGCIRKNSG